MQALLPNEALPLITNTGVTLIDIRSPGEFRRNHLAGAINLAPEALENASLGAGPVLYYCRTGQRTDINQDRLKRAVRGDAYVLKGGIEAWNDQGLPIIDNPKAPLALERQVQLTIGLFLLVAMALSVTVSPWFGLVPAMIGCGLLLAGFTGFCGLGLMLAKMPWNRAGS